MSTSLSNFETVYPLTVRVEQGLIVRMCVLPAGIIFWSEIRTTDAALSLLSLGLAGNTDCLIVD